MNAIRNYSAEWLNNIPPEQALPIWLAGIPTLARDCCEAFGRWPAYFWTTDYVHGTFSFGVKDATALKLVREDPQILAGNQKGRRHFHRARSTSDTNLRLGRRHGLGPRGCILCIGLWPPPGYASRPWAAWVPTDEGICCAISSSRKEISQARMRPKAIAKGHRKRDENPCQTMTCARVSPWVPCPASGWIGHRQSFMNSVPSQHPGDRRVNWGSGPRVLDPCNPTNNVARNFWEREGVPDDLGI